MSIDDKEIIRYLLLVVGADGLIDVNFARLLTQAQEESKGGSLMDYRRRAAVLALQEVYGKTADCDYHLDAAIVLLEELDIA